MFAFQFYFPLKRKKNYIIALMNLRGTDRRMPDKSGRLDIMETGQNGKAQTGNAPPPSKFHSHEAVRQRNQHLQHTFTHPSSDQNRSKSTASKPKFNLPVWAAKPEQRSESGSQNQLKSRAKSVVYILILCQRCPSLHSNHPVTPPET